MPLIVSAARVSTTGQWIDTQFRHLPAICSVSTNACTLTTGTLTALLSAWPLPAAAAVCCCCCLLSPTTSLSLATTPKT